MDVAGGCCIYIIEGDYGIDVSAESRVPSLKFYLNMYNDDERLNKY